MTLGTSYAVVNQSEAAAPERQRVRLLAEQVFAGVEMADPAPTDGGVAARHHYLGHTSVFGEVAGLDQNAAGLRDLVACQ